MSPAQRAAVELWLRDAARLLLLADWRIDVEHEPPDLENNAEVRAVGDHLHARVQVSALLFAEPEPQVRRTLVHELMHLHTNDVDHLAEEHLPESLRPVYARASERLVDQTARLLAESIQLPPLASILRAEPLPSV